MKTGPDLLWVSADPGCGKSVLAKYLVDEILPSTNTRIACYFFFKDDFEDQKSIAGALCCILYQIFRQQPVGLRGWLAERI
jgi:ankyrin repeat domain-containing protein 50